MEEGMTEKYLPAWSESRQKAGVSLADVQATKHDVPPSGQVFCTWDGTDRTGKSLTSGTRVGYLGGYSFIIERAQAQESILLKYIFDFGGATKDSLSFSAKESRDVENKIINNVQGHYKSGDYDEYKYLSEWMKTFFYDPLKLAFKIKILGGIYYGKYN